VIGFSSSWPLVLFSRFLDRLGKGLRTGARDALLLQNTNEKNKGFIFGFHRSLDSVGAVLGPILGLIFIYFFANNLRLIFYLATIPGLFAVLSFVYFSFGVIKDSLFLWFLFPIYGIYISATDGVSKAYLGEFISEKEAGSVYGLYQMLLVLASFFASFVGGILWTKIGPQATFYFEAIMAFLSFSILSFFKFWKKI